MVEKGQQQAVNNLKVIICEAAWFGVTLRVRDKPWQAFKLGFSHREGFQGLAQHSLQSQYFPACHTAYTRAMVLVEPLWIALCMNTKQSCLDLTLGFKLDSAYQSEEEFATDAQKFCHRSLLPGNAPTLTYQSGTAGTGNCCHCVPCSHSTAPPERLVGRQSAGSSCRSRGCRLQN